jgi:hypothetical protein
MDNLGDLMDFEVEMVWNGRYSSQSLSSWNKSIDIFKRCSLPWKEKLIASGPISNN